MQEGDHVIVKKIGDGKELASGVVVNHSSGNMRIVNTDGSLDLKFFDGGWRLKLGKLGGFLSGSIFDIEEKK